MNLADRLLIHLAHFAEFLASAKDADSLRKLFSQAEWEFEVFNGSALEKIFERFSDLAPFANSVIEHVKADKVDTGIVAEQLLQLGKHVLLITQAIADLPPAPGLTAKDTATLAQDLLTVVADDYLSYATPRLRAWLILLRVIQRQPASEILCLDGRIARRAGSRSVIDLNGLVDALTKPSNFWEGLFKDKAGASQTSEALIRLLGDLFTQVGPALGFGVINGIQGRAAGYGLSEEEKAAAKNLIVLDRYEEVDTDDADTGGMALRIVLGCTNDQSGSGIKIVLALGGGFELHSETVTAKLNIGSPYLLLSPNGVELQSDGIGLGASFRYSPQSSKDAPLLQFGKSGSTGFLVGSYVGQADLSMADKSFSLGGELQLDKITILIGAGDGDGFLQKILPEDGIRLNFDLTIGWSNQRGLYFKGGAGFETTLPVNVDLAGVIKIDSVYLALEAKEDSKTKESAIRAVTATTVKVQLGPVSAIVERFGLQATLSFPEKGGNLGVANLDLGFKPPNGIGLVIKAQVVTGGGYLYFDFEKEQYAGVLQLEIAQKFSLTAVGLLTTKMPDGKPGFSLLVIISVRFEPGIQLGYGFSLNGLGGLLGVNRIANTKALQDGLRRGALGSILFPQNVVENAPQIISNLSAIFPPAQDRFLFGPMAIIGWGGSPPILSMEIGIILEFSESFRLMILGRLRVTLPGKSDESSQASGSGTGGEEKKEDSPKIKLQLDSLGIFDFGSGDISLDAYLYDSTIGPFTITGGMSLRASFGAKPMFLLSVGGFHPAFQAPAGFPSLERVAIGLHKKESGVEFRLQLSAYFALTSNTVQFGSHLDLYVHIAGFVEIIGLLGFDALIQFKPFGVIASFEAMVSVKAMGVTLIAVGLQVNLTGPSPWKVWGKAYFEILFMKETAEFSVVIGRPEPPHLPPPMDVELELLKELQKLSNWSSQLPVGESPLVTFRDSIPPKDPASKPLPKKVLIHPLAELHINQRLVPLNTDPITKYGTTTPTGATIFTLTATEKGKTESTSALTVAHLSDWFALAQFYVMTEAQKLSAPSFEEKNSGQRVKAEDGFTCGEPVKRDIEAAKLSKDDDTPTSKSKLDAATYLDQVAHLGAAGQAPIRAAGPAKYGDPTWWGQGITLVKAKYRVVGEEDGDPEPTAPATRRAKAPSPSSLFEGVLDDMAAVAEPIVSYSAAHARATRARQRSPKQRTWVVPDIGVKRGGR